MMNNVLACFAVQKYPASMQSYVCHSLKHGCGMKTLKPVLSFFYKVCEVSSTLEFALLVGSNSPKLFSFLAHLFPPATSQRMRIKGLGPARH